MEKRDSICLGAGGEGLRVSVPGWTTIARRIPQYWLKDDRLDRLCIVLVTVLERQVLRADDDGFSPVSERRLADLVGRDFAGPALDLLCDPMVSVLECDGRCQGTG